MAQSKPRLAAVAPVRELDGHRTDADLVASARAGHRWASTALYKRHAPHIRRVLVRVLGFDTALADIMQETFARAFSKLPKLRDPARFRPWLTSIAVFTARAWIRRRSRGRWLQFFAPEEMPELATTDHLRQEAREALVRTYRTLERLPADERIAFALRYIDSMELAEVAEVCGVSLATVKRRLRRARKRFDALASRDPILNKLLEGGDHA